MDAPAKDITDLAGVGLATLYRHFPRRSDLIVAVSQHGIDASASAATALSAKHEPWEALRAWIGRLTPAPVEGAPHAFRQPIDGANA